MSKFEKEYKIASRRERQRRAEEDARRFWDRRRRERVTEIVCDIALGASVVAVIVAVWAWIVACGNEKRAIAEMENAHASRVTMEGGR